MNSRTRRDRQSFEIECLEGRIALSGGLASIAHVEHAKGHAEVEMHKGGKAEAHHATHTPGADDAAGHDANNDKGHAGHHGGNDDPAGHK